MTNAPTMTWKQILALKPCPGRRDAARAKLRAAYPDIDTRSFTLADAAAAGIDFDCLIWIAGRASDVDPDCARRNRLFGADCAAHVAHIANDPRSTAAIVAARQFARGEIGAEQLNVASAAAWDAWAAARDATWDARTAAGGAAWDARTAASAAGRDAAWAAASAAVRAAARAAWAARAADWDAWAAARDAEEKWQYDRLIAWFSDNEPSDWPMSTAVADAA